MGATIPPAPGVSVVVCCHNSSGRLPRTLSHLAAQVVPAGLAWEVIVVDNGSSDDTAETARRHWPSGVRAPLRVVSEPRPGLSHARTRGFAESEYAFVSFIDDDNRVSPDWVRLVDEILNARPEVGACGGHNEGVYEVPPPGWFPGYEGYLAIGSQGDGPGDVTDTRGVLFGAGLNVRKAAWNDLAAAGFGFTLGDRVGTLLLGGGDTELCFGLTLAGWRLWYDPRLRLEHHIPAGRLTWDYIRRLARGIGRSDAWLDAYRECLTGRRHGRARAVAGALAVIARHPIKFALSRVFPLEGDRHVPVQEQFVGRLLSLLGAGPALVAQRDRLRRADWIRRGASGRDLSQNNRPCES